MSQASSSSTPDTADTRLGDIFPWSEVGKRAPHLFPSRGRIIHLLRQRERNGLAKHLIWLGRFPYISDAGLRAWLESLKRAA